MSDFRAKAEEIRRRRRQQGPWSLEDERKWIDAHPEDEGTASFLTGGAPPPRVAPAAPFDEDLVPDEEATYARSQQDDDIDRLIERIGIVEAYQRWCGKSTPKAGSRTEGIKVSCPNPTHPDRDPSAWLNTDKNVWTCGACDIGGDVLDIAAWHFGLPVPGYKSGKTFIELREKIAQEYGYSITRTPSGTSLLQPVREEETEPEQDAEPHDNDSHDTEETGQPDLSIVTPLPLPEQTDPEFTGEVPWEDLVDEGTFLHAWMVEATNTDVPEEYYFWTGLQALGLVVGDNVTLMDHPPVKANLFCCLTGQTGDGKTKSANDARRLLSAVAPFDPTTGSGVYLIPEPGSAEALVDSFALPITDPTDPKRVIGHASVRGYIKIDELAGLVGRASRMGNPLKPTLMQFFDSYGPVELRSRTTGVVRAVDHFATCVTSTQPRAIRTVLLETDVDSGFLNRWIFCLARKKRRVSYGGMPLDIAVPAEKLKQVRAWGATKRPMHLQGDALDLWDEFFRHELYPSIRDDDSTLTVRCDLLLKKLILLFTINRRVATPTRKEVEDAISLWPYLRYTYSVLQGQIGVGLFEECRQSVEDVAKRYEANHGKPPSQRDIARWLARKKYPLDLLNKVIAEMTKVGQLDEITYTTSGGGRSTVRYQWIE